MYFSTSRRSQSAANGSAVVRQTGAATNSNLPRGQTMSTTSVCVRRRQQIQATKRNIIKMSIAITVGFVVCWAPLFVVSLVRIFSDSRDTWKPAKPISILMVLSHSVVNPFLYIFFSTRTVSAAFLQLCRRAEPRCCWRRRRGSGLEMFDGVPDQQLPGSHGRDGRPVAVHGSGCRQDVPLERRQAAQDIAVVDQCRGTRVRRPTWGAANTSRHSLRRSVTARYGVVTAGSAPAYC